MSLIPDVESPGRRVRRPLIAVLVGLLSAAVLALSFSPTVSAFVASITNTTDTAGTGALTMEEKNGAGTVTCLSTDGGSVSTNTATCATINKFGGSTSMVPGAPVTTQITIKNTGTIPAGTFTLTPGATCTQTAIGAASGNATDLCAKMNLVITSGADTVYTGTLDDFAGHALFTLTGPVAAGATVPFTFVVTLDATAGNTYEGLQAAVPMTWTFTG